uniref:CBU-0592-like domain-containing protein n=1 Tax=Candidatus Kentrum sp. MB TaxID=2138164 RepID=A0A450XYW7_9GAMM|nr:MAG: hypothetical protein BECKMB1821G_GA0114241_101449 [Candidatus Kentron sp. MB]VFK34489.1 MAG: hypothetical protein BECKMB1821I_GA0114274_107313 [Candidatus Kentron sp. MB]VFK76782.1 MAG: hypothetical protein BECKMB1821H_GA0114242_107413 [Candidatus Kentron sp. MB]
MVSHLPDIVGIIGVLLLLFSYLLLQIGKLSADLIAYSLMNFLGAAMILFSLVFDWNLAAALIEGSWALISAFGIYKCLKS